MLSKSQPVRARSVFKNRPPEWPRSVFSVWLCFVARSSIFLALVRHSPPRPDRTERGRDLSDKLFGSITLILHKIMFLKWRLSPAVAARRFHPRASIPPHQRPTGCYFDKRRTKEARNNFILLVLQPATHQLTIVDAAYART